jgi:hypothetical protein
MQEENEEEGEEFPTAELLKEQLSDDEGEYGEIFNCMYWSLVY